jgi:hypothetical protein
MAQSTTEKARDAVDRLKPGDSELTPVAKTVAAAATAAVAGGLAAALKALVEHRSRDDDDAGQDEGDDRERRSDSGERAERAGGAAEREAESSGGRDEEEDERPDDEAPVPEAEQDQGPEAREGRDRHDEDDGRETNGRERAPDGGAARIVEAGRSELEDMLGQQVESISGFRRADEGWCVTYEVVEMRRIPDSSDVLSSYAVVLDDNGELVGLERKHRYRRAQVDGE